MHSPHYTVPLRAGRPVVVTMHDATFFTEPEMHTTVKGTFFRSATRTALRRASRCVVPSKATRDELVRVLEADPTRLDVAYHGVDQATFHVPSDAEKQRVQARLGLSGQPVHRVPVDARAAQERAQPGPRAGSQACAERPERRRRWCWPAGPAGTTSIDRAIAEVPSHLRVLRPGYLRFQDLPGYLGGAQVVAYPSHGEGFGLPVLEAMACGGAGADHRPAVAAGGRR